MLMYQRYIQGMGIFLVSGFLILALNEISFDLMNVAEATCTTLLMILVFLHLLGTKDVLTFVLVLLLTSCDSTVVTIYISNESAMLIV